jgi:hypothetical protein
MAIDDRILYLVREEVDRALGVGELAAGEMNDGPDWIGRLDDLHAEIHTLATKVAALEKKTGTWQDMADSRIHDLSEKVYAPRTRTRKAPEE